MNRNLFKLGAEALALGMPQVVGLLHAQPQPRSVATEAPSRTAISGVINLFGHNPMKRLARYAKLPRCLAHRETERRKDILAQDRAGMGRPSLCTIFHRSLGDHN